MKYSQLWPLIYSPRNKHQNKNICRYDMPSFGQSHSKAFHTIIFTFALFLVIETNSSGGVDDG